MKIEVKTKNEWRKVLLLAVKIAVGSSAAIYIAQILGLEYEASAGTIALLTLVTTKWETVRLSVYRLITFVFSVVLAGITIAVILNLFHDYRSQREYLIHNMRVTEERLRAILLELASYLASEEMQRNVWDDIKSLEADLQGYIGDAYEYQDNTFQSHPGYYIDYFEMRMKQLSTLHNLHYEAKRIRMIPAQAQIIADYIRYLSDYVVEHNSPEEQIGKLEQIFIDMKDEPLPESREEFENRAVLYHILMDLEEFLIMKRRFINGLNEKQRELYWKDEKTDKEAKR